MRGFPFWVGFFGEHVGSCRWIVGYRGVPSVWRTSDIHASIVVEASAHGCVRNSLQGAVIRSCKGLWWRGGGLLGVGAPLLVFDVLGG